MKALTLWQPWATLIAIGAKTIETRSWRTRYRGLVAIHAGKTRLRETEILDLFCEEPEFGRAIQKGFPDVPAFTVGDFPRSAIVAVARLDRCERSDTAPRELYAGEEAFGDYSPGRWLWVLRSIQALAQPVICSGARGLWDVPTDIEDLIRKELP